MNIALAIAVLVLAALAVVFAVRNMDQTARMAEVQADADAQAFKVGFLRGRIQDLLVPLTWSWDLLEADPDHPNHAPLRAYLMAVYIEAQKALEADDPYMTEAILAARETPQPRHLPKAPQVPPFLARPEDIVGLGEAILSRPMPIAPPVGPVNVTGFERHDFDVVTTPPRVAPFRYFVQRDEGPWEETDAQTWLDAGWKTSMNDARFRVEPTTDPARIPEGVKAILFAEPAQG